MKIVFTKHAKKRLKDFAKIGVIIARSSVTATIRNPEQLDRESDKPKYIASSTLDVGHILRVCINKKVI